MPFAPRAELVAGGRRVVVRRAELAEILALRHRELRPGLPAEAAAFVGDDAATTHHVGAFLAEGGANVGCASLMAAAFDGEAALQLRGMATPTPGSRRCRSTSASDGASSQRRSRSRRSDRTT